MRVVRVVSSFSLGLIGIQACFAGPVRDLYEKASELKGAQLRTVLARGAQGPLPESIKQEILGVLQSPNPAELSALRIRLGIAAQAEDGLGQITEVKNLAKDIKASPLYRDDGLKQDANWLSRAGTRFGEFLADLIRRLFGSPRSSGADVDFRGVQNGFQWFIYLVWFLLGGTALFLLYLAVSRYNFRKNLARKARAVLDEDEPERTVDEWLALADRLEAEGKHREAVRCLYLACLLKFDEFGVARFDRGQTNWEHLARIHASPLLPQDLEFRSPTQAFDLIWYGMRTQGAPDVARFREIYQGVLGRLSEVVR